MKVSPHPFEVPAAGEFPPLFTGFVCVGYAGGRWFSGCDTDSSMDAFHRMQDAARLALLPAVAVEKQLDVSFFQNTVQMFRVSADE